MKFVVENMIRFLVTVFAAALVLTSVGELFVPVLSAYLPSMFYAEKNFTDSSSSAGPAITCRNEVYIPRNGTVDLFDSDVISAKSSSGEELNSQLEADFEKDVALRDHVFVYKINADNTNVLCAEIDTSVTGKWIVVYWVADDGGSASAQVTYIVS